VREGRHRLAATNARMVSLSPEYRIRQESQRLLSLWKRLQSVSPGSVLQRGFVIIKGPSGIPITRSKAVAAGAHLEAEFHDGSRRVRAE